MTGRERYFLDLQAALHRAATCQPVLVLDMAAFDHNLDQLAALIPAGMNLRLVAKSLPVPALIDRAASRLGTDRLMSFNLAMLKSFACETAPKNQLLGKPLPVAAAREYLSLGLNAQSFQWLIDTPERLAQYGALARDSGCDLNICLEIDVGLHRGGFAGPQAVAKAARLLADLPGLRLTGLMGYDAHLGKVPRFAGWRQRQIARVQARYRAAVAAVRQVFPDAALTLNGAGSPTLPFHTDTGILNEVAAGSVLVKPTDFDLPHLADFRPALFIATPVLKQQAGMQTPVLEILDPVKRLFNPALARSLFIHGGYWKAQPVDPPGLRVNGTYGRSSNQELLNLPAGPEIAVDDFVFLRPTQSEAVMTQFGPIAVYEDGSISRWLDPFAPMP